MRPVTAALCAVSVVLTLSGCSLLAPLISTFRPDSTPLPLVIGSCLAGMNGADSDRGSIVDCDEPHLFQVTSIDQWPGMADAIEAADGDLGAVWDDIHLVNGSTGSVAYGEWASRNCNEAAQRTVGIADVEVDGHTAANLWLRVGGTYGVDLSLGSREQFIAGDVATICSMAWYDDSGPRLLATLPFEKLVHPGFDPDLRECWADDYTAVSCAQPHAAQVMLSFEGLEAFGPDLVGRAAVGGATEADWDVVDAFCEQLLLQTMPSTADFGELGYLGETSASYSWDEFDGTVDAEGAYFFSCLALGDPGDVITGDVFEGAAVIEAAGSAA